jgi:hypothetical protein
MLFAHNTCQPDSKGITTRLNALIFLIYDDQPNSVPIAVLALKLVELFDGLSCSG